MFYDRYWQDTNGHLSDFGLKWPKLKRHIPQQKGTVIVDFGCGKGEIMKEISAINPGARVIGLDVSETALKDARVQSPGFDFHKIEDGGRFPLETNSSDFVFSSEVIEHVYDTENAFKEISRILKRGGKLLLTTPYHGFIKNLLIVLFDFDRHFNPTGPHVRFFSKNSLFVNLRKNGFKITDYGFYGRFYPISHSIFVLAEKQ